MYGKELLNMNTQENSHKAVSPDMSSMFWEKADKSEHLYE